MNDDSSLYRIILVCITPTRQISLDTKQICLGNLLSGISVIHFALYYTAH